MGKKAPRMGKDRRPRGCRHCGGTGKQTIMALDGVYTDPKTGKTYEVRKPKVVNCTCQS